ncbi:hypothetical protein BDR05DRAFT_124192 [Suillus weaverae]|nr:hypothetical protein BDR05DRAFT_124192 [Suillus weaverae]
MEHPMHALHPCRIHNRNLGMNTHPSSRSNMLVQAVVRIMSHLRLPHLDPLIIKDNHPTIPPVSPPLVTPLLLPQIYNPTQHPHRLIPNHTSSTTLPGQRCCRAWRNGGGWSTPLRRPSGYGRRGSLWLTQRSRLYAEIVAPSYSLLDEHFKVSTRRRFFRSFLS